MNKIELKTRGVSHYVALPFTLNIILKAKEEVWKLKYFTMQKYNLPKNPLKETKTFQDIKTLSNILIHYVCRSVTGALRGGGGKGW
jgi:hypothetical protein